MKATGIIRRIDDLGRVVIPREIRNNLNINAGDPLEIFVDKDSVVFTKYYSDDNQKIVDGLHAIINAIENLDEEGEDSEDLMFIRIFAEKALESLRYKDEEEVEE